MNSLRITKSILFMSAFISLISPFASAQEDPNESLHQAIIAGDTKQVQNFIANGVNINSRNRQTWTPLHTAIWYSTNEMVELIISKGPDINAQNNQGYTPLHFAAIKGNSDAANLLIAKGADVNSKDPTIASPLYLAVESGQKDLVELLISKGADVNAHVGSENVLSTAQKKGNNEIIDLLVKHGAKEPTVNADTQPYGRGGQTEGPAGLPPGGLNPYQDTGGQVQPGISRESSSRAETDTISDPNEIKARIKTFEGLEKALEETDNKSRSEKAGWLQRKIDNRTGLIKLVEEQVKQELTLVRNIATEEKAEKTTKAIDNVLSSRNKLSDEILKELLVQRKETQGPRGRSQSRSTRGTRGTTQSPYQGQQPAQEGARPYSGRSGITPRASGLRSEPNESQPADLEVENKINQWLQTATDSKQNLMQNVNTDIQTQYISIRTVAIEEGAKKTTAAIDGLLLNRQERYDDLIMRMEREAQQQQEPRGRNTGRTTRGGQQSQWGQPGQGMTGQEQYQGQSSTRSRRR